MFALWRLKSLTHAGLFAATMTGFAIGAHAETSSIGAHTSAGISAVRRVNQLVADIDAVLPFYRDLLGFRVIYDQENSNAAELSLIGLPAERARVVALQSPRRDIAGGLLGLIQILDPITRPAPTTLSATSLLLLTDDAKALFKRLKQAGVVMLSELTSYKAARTSGTTQAFTVADPSGVRVTFAELAGPVPE